MKYTHQLFAVLVAVIWGSNFVLIRWGLDELPSFTFASMRFLFVALPLMFIIPKPVIAWRILISYGVLIGFGQFGLLFWIMQDHISPGLASLIIQAQVFMTIGLSMWRMKEAMTTGQPLALAICLAGLLIIIIYTDGQTTTLGIAVILLAALSWSLGNLLVKSVGKVDILAFLAWSAPFSVLPLALMALTLEGLDVAVSAIYSASLPTWLIVLWQSVGNTLLGYGLWNWLLHRYPSKLVTPWALLVPVSGMLCSWFFYKEAMPWWKLMAAGLILSGLALNLRASQKMGN